MATAIARRQHTAGILAALKAATSATPIGDHEAPASAGVTYAPPYAVLYVLDIETEGDLADPDVDARVSCQVTCVGETRDQAESLSDELADVMLNDTITITGRTVTDRVPSRGTVAREDTPEGPRFSVPDRYVIATTAT